MDGSKRFTWAFLLSKGYVTDEISFYGVCKDYGRDTALREDYTESDIDWEETKEPEGDTDSFFVSTFDDPGYKSFMSGTIYMNDGAKFLLYYEVEDPMEIMSFMRDYNPSKPIL